MSRARKRPDTAADLRAFALLDGNRQDMLKLCQQSTHHTLVAPSTQMRRRVVEKSFVEMHQYHEHLEAFAGREFEEEDIMSILPCLPLSAPALLTAV
jgi:hypothetical protein